MRKVPYLMFTVLVSLAPAPAGAASPPPAPAPAVDECSSARPVADFMALRARCAEKAAARRAAARIAAPSGAAPLATKTVFQARTKVASLNFANVPTWSDSDIALYFASTRDKRYFTDYLFPNENPRRITWLLPQDLCYARAEQVEVQIAAAGKTRPYKIFAFGTAPMLRAFTPNDPSGMVSWQYHVVPIVKNSAGVPIVFDAALSPCRPLYYKDWLALLVDDMALYDNIAAGNGVTISDSWAYNSDSLVTGETPHAYETLSFQDISSFLETEHWMQVDQLGNSPDVLTTNPPWGNGKCLKTFAGPSPQTLMTSGATATLTATCPYATLVVGGGYSADPSTLISKTAISGNSWQVIGKNTSSGQQYLSASSVCLQGAPSGASLVSIQGSVIGVANNAFNTSTATCSTGTLIAGGFTTDVSGTPAKVMRIYYNGRQSATSNVWQVQAYNLTGAQKNVTAFAYCLQGATGYSGSQTGATLQSGGVAAPYCDSAKLPLGGGWSFPRTSAYTLLNMQNWAGPYDVWMQPDPGPNGDVNARGYEECLAHP